MTEPRRSPASARPSRRAVVAGGVGIGVAGFLAACSGPSRASGGASTPAGSASPTASGGHSGPGGASGAGDAGGPRTWAELADAADGPVLRAGSSGWSDAKQLRNPRYDDADPRGILLATSAADVAAGLAFARNTRIPVALRSGGHSYTGWSAGGGGSSSDMPRSLVISTARLDTVELSDDGSSVTIGPGAQLGDVYAALAAKGRAIGAGSCSTVGIGGLTLGGGVGVLVRSFGLTADQLTGATIVTPDGHVHEVSARRESDLFWACRGGGGATAGVVTSLTFATQPAPEVLTFEIVFPWSAAAAAVAAWQDWAPTADRRLWSSLKLLAGSRHPSGPVVTVSGTWTGPKSGADASVDRFVAAVGTAPLSHGAEEQSYGQAMRALGGNGGRVSQSATSSIGGAALSSGQIATLLDQVAGASAVDGLTEGGVALDALGGAVSEVGPTDTPFPWRSALWTVQYTAGFADGADPAPYDAYVRGFRQAMTPAWGTSAYANYCDAAITDPSDYFERNTSRLHRIAAGADPDGLLAQPHWV